MDFCSALKHMKAGKIIKRQGTDITSHRPFWYHIFIDFNYLKLNPVARDGYFFPIKYRNEFDPIVYDWQPLQSDLFAMDWEIAKIQRRKIDTPRTELPKENIELDKSHETIAKA